ncbi:MAG: methyltransferase domain-containing protein [Acidobacteria bacterium]|nr:methyltransferase domain-containing protein [Acidobacteriota bacterium]
MDFLFIARLFLRFLARLSLLALLFLPFPCGSSSPVHLSAAPWPVAAQTVAPPQTPPRKTSRPYTGDLSVFEYKDRDKKLQVERVMDILGICSAAAVADIGAGSGWFTVRAARRAGASGRVYAVDINPDYVAYVKDRVEREGFRNVQTILGKEDDPLLPPESIDSALLLKTYHELAQPVRLLQNLRKSLRAEARVGIIDRKGNGDDHGVPRAVVIDEARAAGYELIEEYDFVKGDGMDYFLVFRPR